MASAPDERVADHGGESRNGHFDDAAQKARMATVIGSRRRDRSELTFDGEPLGDD